MAGPATDFVCKMDCHKGPSAANGAPNVPPEGIFNPPYTINNNLTQVNITVKVCMLAAVKNSMCGIAVTLEGVVMVMSLH